MDASGRCTACRLTPIAETGGRFAEFAPYVPALNLAGTVAFQAAMADGRTGVFLGDGGAITAGTDPADPRLAAITSHPDLNDRGDLTCYARDVSGHVGLVLRTAGTGAGLVDAAGPHLVAGPLGPTLSNGGAVAFRATIATGVSGIFRAVAGGVAPIAETGGGFAGFRGLPVINDGGTVVFRADLCAGGAAILAAAPGCAPEVVADTAGAFAGLGDFPAVNRRGTVAFVATGRDGRGAVCLARAGEVRLVRRTGAEFEGFRGALVDDDDGLVFFATPRGGRPGIYSGPDPSVHRWLGLGDPLLGSHVSEFALNPVSINAAGQLAVRVRLEDGRGLILRAAPAG